MGYRPFLVWFKKVCAWVAVRLTCFRARAQRRGTRNREGREADYDYGHDSYVESCNPELNQPLFLSLPVLDGSSLFHRLDRSRGMGLRMNGKGGLNRRISNCRMSKSGSFSGQRQGGNIDVTFDRSNTPASIAGVMGSGSSTLKFIASSYSEPQL